MSQVCKTTRKLGVQTVICLWHPSLISEIIAFSVGQVWWRCVAGPATRRRRGGVM